MKLKTVVVDRAKWWRGKPNSALKVAQADAFCCLGFCGLSVGIKPETMLRVSTPENLEQAAKMRQVFPKLFVGPRDYPEDSAECSDLVDVNDDREIEDKEREVRLRATGRKAGILFKFVGE